MKSKSEFSEKEIRLMSNPDLNKDQVMAQLNELPEWSASTPAEFKIFTSNFKKLQDQANRQFAKRTADGGWQTVTIEYFRNEENPTVEGYRAALQQCVDDGTLANDARADTVAKYHFNLCRELSS